MNPWLRPEHAFNGLKEVKRMHIGGSLGSAYLDASTAGHALYSQLALVYFLKGAAQRLVFDVWKFDLARCGGKSIPMPKRGESGRDG